MWGEESGEGKSRRLGVLRVELRKCWGVGEVGGRFYMDGGAGELRGGGVVGERWWSIRKCVKSMLQGW